LLHLVGHQLKLELSAFKICSVGYEDLVIFCFFFLSVPNNVLSTAMESGTFVPLLSQNIALCRYNNPTKQVVRVCSFF